MFDDGQATTERLASSRARHAYFTPGKNARRRSRSVGDYVRDLKRKTDGDALKFTTTSRDKVIRITAEIAGVSENYRDTPPTRSVLVDYRDPTVTASSLRPSQVTQKKPESIELAAVAADEGASRGSSIFRAQQDKSRLDEEDLAEEPDRYVVRQTARSRKSASPGTVQHRKTRRGHVLRLGRGH